MELLDRYLKAVGRYLPANRRENILAEMKANILSLGLGAHWRESPTQSVAI